MDVHIGIVDEHTRLHITCSVDMQIVPAPGDAAAHILGIVLEVHAENGLGLTEPAHPLIDCFPLLRRGQQSGDGLVAHRHIVEEPHEHA